MGDSEIKNETENRESGTTEAQDKTKAEATEQKQAKTDKEPKKKNSFFRSLKAEFKRVVWPDRDTIVKETTAVVIVTVILGAIIALLDFVIKAGLDKIIQIG